jgi:hypothetical protein
MRTSIKVGLAGIGIMVLAFAALTGTSAYFVLRHLNVGTATEDAAMKDFEAIRSRFGTRPHLVEVIDSNTHNFRVNIPPAPNGRPISTLHVFTWNQQDGDVFRTEIPVWLMRFSLINVLSNLGMTPERFRLTIQDLQAYGPGIIVDYRKPGEKRVLLWVE